MTPEQSGVGAVTVTVVVDGRDLQVPAGASVLDACDLAGVYVPRLCAYPGLEPVGDCGLCFVRIDGAEVRRACAVEVAPGMRVDTQDEEARGFRTGSMKAVLGDHPHVCLVCPQRDGCSRDDCMYGNPPETRCCSEFGRCEIAKVAAYVGALAEAPGYQYRELGATRDHNIRRDLDLCIGCGRCVAACDTLEEAGSALRLVETKTLVAAAGDGPGGWAPRSYLGRHVAVPKAVDLRASGCTFCGACVLVCPTGALTAPGPKGATWLAKRKERTTLRSPVLPPEDRLPFTAAEVQAVPTCAGVFRLFAGTGAVLQISGVMNLRAGLEEALRGSLADEAQTFVFEAEPMYTQRESELLAHHLQEHGSLPRGNDVLGDLFDEDDDLF
ncbi:MAG: 2Fe-2S iron-sulfur cluster-binding protein [Actinobacteria bacterium]|nr:2Fe-2S iron-sulfur cluster-binding protein [Actinomycetota bacterium]